MKLQKILLCKSCCLGREQSDNRSSTDSPNQPADGAWCITGPGTWGEAGAFQQPAEAIHGSQLFYSHSWTVPLSKVSLLRLTVTSWVPDVIIHIKQGVDPWSLIWQQDLWGYPAWGETRALPRDETGLSRHPWQPVLLLVDCNVPWDLFLSTEFQKSQDCTFAEHRRPWTPVTCHNVSLKTMRWRKVTAEQLGLQFMSFLFSSGACAQ